MKEKPDVHEHRFKAFNPFHPDQMRCEECGTSYAALGPFAKRKARMAAYEHMGPTFAGRQ
jgi:hypothetical protein